MVLERDRVAVDGEAVRRGELVYVAYNKPRGLVTTAADERGRATVLEKLREIRPDLPFLSPVGRLDKASEGLLLFTNDTGWAAAITDPRSHLEKIYHVQVGSVATVNDLEKMREGVVDAGEHLAVARAAVIRAGEKNCWLELAIDEGRNRHLRRLLAGLGFEVKRLIRVAIGPLRLDDLQKGKARLLSAAEAGEISFAAAKSRVKG